MSSPGVPPGTTTVDPKYAEEIEDDPSVTPVEAAPAEQEPSAPAEESGAGSEEEAPTEEAIIQATIERFRELKEANPELAKKLAEEAGLAQPDEQVLQRELELNKQDRYRVLGQAAQLYNAYTPQMVGQQAYQDFSRFQAELAQGNMKALEDGDPSKLVGVDPQSTATYVADLAQKAQNAASYWATASIQNALLEMLQSSPVHRQLTKDDRTELAEAAKKPTAGEQTAAIAAVYLKVAGRPTGEVSKKAAEDATKQADLVAKAQRLLDSLPKNGRRAPVAAPALNLSPTAIANMSDEEFAKNEQAIHAAYADALKTIRR